MVFGFGYEWFYWFQIWVSCLKRENKAVLTVTGSRFALLYQVDHYATATISFLLQLIFFFWPRLIFVFVSQRKVNYFTRELVLFNFFKLQFDFELIGSDILQYKKSSLFLFCRINRYSIFIYMSCTTFSESHWHEK